MEREIRVGASSDGNRQVFRHDKLARSLAVRWWADMERSPEIRAAVKEGKMFGLLVSEPTETSIQEAAHTMSSETHDEQTPDLQSSWVQLIACSGQLGGLWNPPGWAPSLLDHHKVAGASWRAQRDLHRFTYQIQQAHQKGDAVGVAELKRLRRARSEQHADELRRATVLTPLIGAPLALSELWVDAATGVGACCAPKLICWAARCGLKPLGIAEFQITYHDSVAPRPPRAELITRVATPHYDLSFYAPCHARCVPLLPFLLNGERESSS